jgi:hypothetical protein
MQYEEIDRQWVATEAEADELEARLAPRAERYGFVIGRKSDRDGYLVTVEKPPPAESGHEEAPASRS